MSLQLDEELIARRATELFLAKKIAEYAGELTGAQVVSLHRCVVEKLCRGKRGWEALKCIVDKMDEIYRRVKEIGFEATLREYTCV